MPALAPLAETVAEAATATLLAPVALVLGLLLGSTTPAHAPGIPSSHQYLRGISDYLSDLNQPLFAMLALKRLITVAVVVYLLLALLFIFVPSVRLSVVSLGPGLSVLEQERQFFYILFMVGAVVMALQLITENLDSVLLRRTVNKSEGKINELKAKLYDHQQRGTTASVPGSRTVDGRNLEPSGRPDHLPTPTFPQADPSLGNTPPAERPAL